jgi:CheY-like chemotaxis protein
MTSLRVLHVDDESDIREVVQISLQLDPDIAVRACACGVDALAVAAEWSPDLILLDVMMPVMDGPATFTHLRKDPRTASIPVVFMTARAQTSEIERFIRLGARGVVSKPFDPMKLAAFVRSQLQTNELGPLQEVFRRRAKKDAGALMDCRSALAKDANSPALTTISEIAHRLAGSGGIYGFHQISGEAAALEDLVIAKLGGAGTLSDVLNALDRVVALIESEPTTSSAFDRQRSSG